MPKNNKISKVNGLIVKQKVASKFRIGNRKSTKSANAMSNAALLAELENNNHRKSKNKIIAVLRNRGVAIPA